MEKNKNFIYGIATVKSGDLLIGWIEKGSWDWGGTKPETVDVEAEQVPDAPVLTLLQKTVRFLRRSISSRWIIRTYRQ